MTEKTSAAPYSNPEIAHGFCHCGCGYPAPFSETKGRHFFFIRNHQNRPYRPMPKSQRLCSGCQKIKWKSEFATQAKGLDGLRNRCYACEAESAKRSRERRPGASQRNNLKIRLRQYGSTIEEYDRLFAEQGGVCSICGNPETRIRKDGTVRSLSADHSHRDNRVRALLCTCCNVLIGMSRDDPVLLEAAIAYLKRHER